MVVLDWIGLGWIGSNWILIPFPFPFPFSYINLFLLIHEAMKIIGSILLLSPLIIIIRQLYDYDYDVPTHQGGEGGKTRTTTTVEEELDVYQTK